MQSFGADVAPRRPFPLCYNSVIRRAKPLRSRDDI
jgi:hypothetical protein